MVHLSVKEFADATNRFPNQIYDLINKGNQFRKLKSQKIKGRINIPVSEINDFPFNSAIKLRIELQSQIVELTKRVDYLEDRVYL